MKRVAVLIAVAATFCATARNIFAQLSVLHSFHISDGSLPEGVLLGSDSVLYGTTNGGGTTDTGNAVGTVFRMNTDGTGFTMLHTFSNSGSDGFSPQAALTQVGSTLFGTTKNGSSNNPWGTIFKINTDGTSFAVLYSFATSALSYSSLAVSGDTLFGTTSVGGANGVGSIFKINTDGTGFATLHSFTSADGREPRTGLTISGSTLYGTTFIGGAAGLGTVFKINTDGSGFSVLKSFTSSTGYEPLAPVLVVGSRLFGTTSIGGPPKTNSVLSGTLFEMNTDGTDFTLLHSFNDFTDGYSPQSGLLISGSTLYGTTGSQGAFPSGSGHGTIFQINTDGTGYSKLHTFTQTATGIAPHGDLAISGNTLYGTTSGNGIVFSFAVPEPESAVLCLLGLISGIGLRKRFRTAKTLQRR